MTIKQGLTALNGWGKVITVVFACGVLWAKVEQLRSDVAELKISMTRFTTITSVHETRISTIEGQLYTLFLRGAQ